MKIQRALTPATLLILAVLLLTPADIFSCGPFFTEAVFVSRSRPAPSLDDYLTGHLGVVQPTYYPVYLAIAYRVLSGKPIDSAEIAKAKKYWSYDRLVIDSDDTAMREWYVARAATLGERAPSDQPLGQLPNSFTAYRRRDGYFNAFMNCTSDAFRNAALTVQERSKRFGAGTPAMQDWVQAQNAVFSNCAKNSSVPAAAPANADPLIKADRQYQTAAAHFYREEFDDARKEFLQIAQDHSSPWRTIAPYLATRSLIRQATIAAPEDKPADPKLLAQSRTELQAILADPSAKDIHPAARRTLGFVEFRLSPDERMHTLALQISGQQPTTDLGQDLIDYTRLLDRPNVPVDVSKPPQPPPKIKVADDLTDWILTAQAHADNDARAHALERWQQTRALPWLIAALVKTNAGDPGVDALMSAAAAVPDNSPGHDSASFHRARLLMQMQKNNEARTLLDRELARVPAPPNQTRNLYLGMRWQLAQNFDEYLKFAPQMPVAFDTGDDTYCYDDNCADSLAGRAKNTDTLLDLPVAAAFSQRTPLQLLAQATQSSALPANLRQALVLATWARAAILGDSAQAVALGKNLGQVVPSTAQYMSDYAAAKDAGAREFAAAFAMLHYPGMRPYVNQGILRDTALDKIDNYRDNWWCKDFGSLFKVSTDDNSYTYLSYTMLLLQDNHVGASTPPGAVPEWPSFLSPSQRSVAEAEWKQLSQIDAAPNYLGKVVLAWAKSHPNDPRVPEALHLVVRSTRYGCGDEDTGQFSLDAFDLLHIRYPKSEWTKKTPLWFK